MTDATRLQALEPPLRRVLRDCRKLYAACAKLMVQRHPTELGTQLASFPQLMEDLHRGLVIKVFTEIVQADGRWTTMEKQVAAMLIEHLWEEHLRGERLREAIEGLLCRSESLTWGSLLAPFVRYHPLRDGVAQVETIVSRLANLIAKCDGQPSAEETRRLHELQATVSSALRARPGGEPAWREPTSRETEFLHSPQQPTQAPAGEPGRPPGNAAQRGSGTRPPTAVTASQVNPAQRLAEALAELDALVGLVEVKKRIRSLSNFLQLQRKRQRAGLATMPISLHMSFVGNPGTGKTTVARIVGQILGSMGILPSGHLVETDRSGLVAAYAGQTAPKTNALCDSALGGVLFIDEAYSLVDSSGEDVYGREAIQTLLKRMEDDRDQFVVIVAGYPDEMDQMIRSNPGLSSRINTRIEFPDYSPIELGRIFEMLCKRNDYRLPAESRHRLLVAFADAYRQRDRHFGNGRLARNAFEDCVRHLADRIADVATLTDELMTQLKPEDISLPGIPHRRIDELIAQPHALRAVCPQCGQKPRVRGATLGKTVRCPSCQTPFAAAWAEVEHEPTAGPS